MVFPTFCNLSLNFAIRSSWTEPQSAPGLVFCLLYRASPSLAAKNIIHLISVLIIWWCPCLESSLVLLEEGVCYDQCVLLAELCYPLPCFLLYSKAKFAGYSRYLLTSYFCIPAPYDEKDVFLGGLVLEGLVGLHRTFQLQLLQHYWLRYRLGLLWCWMVCLGNEQRSFCCFWDRKRHMSQLEIPVATSRRSHMSPPSWSCLPYLWLIHTDVGQKPTQLCKAVILHLKIKEIPHAVTKIEGLMCHR